MRRWSSAVPGLVGAGGLLICLTNSLFATEPAADVPENGSPAAVVTPSRTPAAPSLAEIVRPELLPTVDPDLPAVFSKRVPEGPDDLREMQAHLRSLAERLAACTVGLQIGPAQGSGVIVSSDGYILTAAHVSGKPGRRVDIVLQDGKRYTGITYGRDDMLDAGLIKFDVSREWPHADMAPADSIEYGEWCVATGHPGGYHEGRAPVLRLGRVSVVTNRVLQSDCELVGGDSGGPLFDMHGRVIGINSRIGERTESNFHVPVGAFTKSWDRLVASESFKSPSGALLGVRGEPDPAGLKITEASPGEPAAEAGVQVGDILVTFESKKITNIDELIKLVGTYQPKQKVDLELLRDGKLVELTVRLGFRFD
jgi:serine protease Do